MPAIHPGEELRAVMRHVPSPVAILAFPGPDGPRGITIGSFTSVSLDPPLVSFNIMLESSMHDVLLSAEQYAVHILSDDQVTLSQRFAVPSISSAEQFDGIAHTVGGDGIPVIDGILASIKCRSHTVVPAGDHSLFIGEVLEINEAASGKPLLYYQHSYRKVGSLA